MRLALAAAGLFLAAFSFRAFGQTAPLEEIVVTGEQPGPGLWHVHKGAGQLWLFGTVAPLPKKITWRSKRLEGVLEHADRLMVEKPINIGISRAIWLFMTKRSLFMLSGGRKLKDVLPADLYARFDAQRSRFSKDHDKWEKYRPLLASLQLGGAAFESAGLSDDIDLDDAARKLARKHHVAIEELELGQVSNILDILKEMPPETENRCVAATLSLVESDLPRVIERANAWATGNVDELTRLSQQPEVASCFDAVLKERSAGDAFERARSIWNGAMLGHLERGGSTVVVMSVRDILRKDGALDRLREAGYTVDPL